MKLAGLGGQGQRLVRAPYVLARLGQRILGPVQAEEQIQHGHPVSRPLRVAPSGVAQVGYPVGRQERVIPSSQNDYVKPRLLRC